ncbi:bifunctional transcriptional activator/DNA repair enzyme AdaA [Psychrobacillus vulpis]|uniref:Methylphosphotriester-DNA--protein-cysteine methyltransferase family protein n=1 Tax=Psychrobacillus vulpis TaxID=2325572 RepID=A0A544TW20_9BACI|nr:bifunctional transcriptional activator/DNA repair enzyme AdaA [Psychrobacillus vulpis]TQR21601.1 methylphosphotriester-DNA--protein-cysteine methyltransferase family protein [Psychrobacillus vulpis]
MKNEKISDEQWEAIVQNNPAYDEVFYYAVKSTGIFCRPSCKSRPPKKENVRIYLEAKNAVDEGFRPCKRCKPSGLRLPDVEWVTQIKEYIDLHYDQPLTLDNLADICHGSPYHLQRTFKKILGLSPVEYMQQIRIEKAKELLITSNKSLADIGSTIGMHNIPYFITLFKKLTGKTPIQYKKKEVPTDE